MENLESKLKKIILSLPKPIISTAVEVRDDSLIHGTGLFALREIKKGEIVVVEQGLIVDGKIVELCESIDFHTNLCIERNQYIISAPLKENQRGYINHSCNPNLGMGNDRTMIAIKDIAIGDEVTIDYGFFESHMTWEMTCNCNSENCRKTITGRDYLIFRETEQEQYLSPYLKPNKINLNSLQKNVGILEEGTSNEAVQLWNKYEEQATFSIDNIKDDKYLICKSDVSVYLSQYQNTEKIEIEFDESTIANDITNNKTKFESEKNLKCVQIIEYPLPLKSKWGVVFVF